MHFKWNEFTDRSSPQFELDTRQWLSPRARLARICLFARIYFEPIVSRWFALPLCIRMPHLIACDTETSLKDIDAVQLRLAAQIARQRATSAQLQNELSATFDDDMQRMATLQELIGDLFTQIHHLRTGATESEIVVREITRDIKTLDLAKKNIVSSMTGVKRFQMLGRSLLLLDEGLTKKVVNGFDQLTRLAKAKRYRETAQSLLVSGRTRALVLCRFVSQAIKELQTYFRSYTAIERIHNLFQGIQEVQAIIRDQVMNDFKAGWAESSLPLVVYRLESQTGDWRNKSY